MNATHPLTNHFRIFLSERPAISPERLAAALGIDPANLHKIIHHSREIPKHRRGDFWRMMLRYGYSNLEPCCYWVLLPTTNDKTSLLQAVFFRFFKYPQYVLIDFTNLGNPPHHS